MIELNKASPGDRFEARDGEVWTYVGPYDFEPGWHLLRSAQGRTSEFSPDGGYYGDEVSPYDLIRALGSPAPAEPEQGDAGLLELVDDYAHAAAELARCDQSEVPDARAKKNSSRASLLTRIEALLAENFALAADQCHAGYSGEHGHHCCREVDAALLRATKADAALEEARRVSEKFRLFVEAIGPHVQMIRRAASINHEMGRVVAGQVDAAEDLGVLYDQTVAARDWHSKNGGGDA